MDATILDQIGRIPSTTWGAMYMHMTLYSPCTRAQKKGLAEMRKDSSAFNFILSVATLRMKLQLIKMKLPIPSTRTLK